MDLLRAQKQKILCGDNIFFSEPAHFVPNMDSMSVAQCWSYVRDCGLKRHPSWGRKPVGELFVCTLLVPDAAGERRRVRQYILNCLRTLTPNWKVTGPQLDSLQHAVKTVSVIYDIVRLFHGLGLTSVVREAAKAMTVPKVKDKFMYACPPSVFMASIFFDNQ